MKRHVENRIEFLKGVIEGITMYAIWDNGEQLVGCMQTPLIEVLAKYIHEIQHLKEDANSYE